MKNRLLARSVCIASAATLACGLMGGTAFAATNDTTGVAKPNVGPAAVAGATTYRLAGADRYDTAIAISKQWYTTGYPKTVYVASGENFPDALAAAPIAGMNRAPVLLTPAAALPDKVLAEITRLKPTRIVVVGGTGAVSDAVMAKLAGAATTVDRISGADRYATSRAVIKDGMITNPDFAITAASLDSVANALADQIAGLYEASLKGTAAYKNAGAVGHATKPVNAFTANQKEAIKNVRTNYLAVVKAKIAALGLPELRTADNMKALKDDLNALVTTELTAGSGGTAPDAVVNVLGGTITYSAFQASAALQQELTPAEAAPINSSLGMYNNLGDMALRNSVASASATGVDRWLVAPCDVKTKAGKATVVSSTYKKKDCAAVQSVFDQVADATWVFFSAKEAKSLAVLKTGSHEALSFYFATGRDFPDALSIGAIGGNWYGGQPGPVFLEDGQATSVSDENRRLMNELAQSYSVSFKERADLGAAGEEGTFRTYVIGGTGAMTDDLLNSISSVKYSEIQTVGNPLINQKIVSGGKAVRLGGADRYATSQEIVKTLKTPYAAGDAKQGVLATGTNFPDALAGSAYAAASNSTLWVTKPECVTAGIGTTATKLGITQFALLGGVGALTEPIDKLASCA